MGKRERDKTQVGNKSKRDDDLMKCEDDFIGMICDKDNKEK